MAGYIKPESVWHNNEDYDRSFFNYLQREVEQHWEFMSWLKYTHPEALIEWKALKKIEES